MADPPPLAHSAPDSDSDPQRYCEHAANVRTLGDAYAEAVKGHAGRDSNWNKWQRPISVACEWHDLGKLDPDNQSALRKGRGTRLPYDHVDAGVAHVLSKGDEAAAWLIRAHHRPGLPSAVTESLRRAFTLRGERWEGDDDDKHRPLVTRNDAQLDALVASHRDALGQGTLLPEDTNPHHGLAARFALGCLVDADHTDSARFDAEGSDIVSPATEGDGKWSERLRALRNYVAGKQAEAKGDPERNAARQLLFDHCADDQPLADTLVTCDAAVGLGKTTAVLAYLLRQAIQRGLRRIIIVAPFTNILSQTAEVLREALLLDDENPDNVLLEHHHRAEFEDQALRASSVIWDSPIILTTAVQFFETLGSNSPTALRKLHRLPGSAIFIDESHAALPYRMWPQCFEWLKKLARDWNCPTVLASGSQIKFWESEWGRAGLTPGSVFIPDITPNDVASFGREQESSRVKLDAIERPITCEELSNRVTRRLEQGRPQLVILNTIHSTVGLADALSQRFDSEIPHDNLCSRRILHLSTALTPAHRERVLAEIARRMDDEVSPAWTLVATSCVEAGVNLDLHDGFREEASVTSAIQTSGRVNRNGNWKDSGLTRFRIADDPRFKPHPEFKLSASILRELAQYLEDEDPRSQHTIAKIATEAAKREVTRAGAEKSAAALVEAVRANDYPKIAELCRVIMNSTITVLADKSIKEAIEKGEKISSRHMLRHSLQLWPNRVDDLGLERIRSRSHKTDLFYASEASYDDSFLGIGKAILGAQILDSTV